MSSLLKVGGRDGSGIARALTLTSEGGIRVENAPSKNLFMGEFFEPYPDDYSGVYAVFGLQVEYMTKKNSYPGQRYDNWMFAKGGYTYYITQDTFPNSYLAQVSNFNGIEKRVKLNNYSSGKQPSSIISLGKNILVANNAGDAELLDALSLVKVKDVTLDALAYSDNGKFLGTNPNLLYSTQVIESDKTLVLSSNRITAYNHEAVAVATVNIADTLGDSSAHLRHIYSFSADSNYYYISGSFKGIASNTKVMILIIKRTDGSLVHKITEQDDLPYVLIPSIIASDEFGVLSIERTTGSVTKWNVSDDEYSYDTTAAFILDDLFSSASTESTFITTDGSIVAVRTSKSLYLFDAKKLELLWSVDAPAVSNSGSVWFDGVGHVCFMDSDNSVYVANKFLQVQGYGVR